MTDDIPRVERPSPVTELPIIAHDPSARRIEAAWPLRNIHSGLDGDGVEYAVLTVSHVGSRRAYLASLNRMARFSGSIHVKPFDATRVGSPIPVGRFSQKSLQGAFDVAIRTLREEIAAGDSQLASYFTPTEGDTF